VSDRFRKPSSANTHVVRHTKTDEEDKIKQEIENDIQCI
jgi:hypothetical protein